MAGKCISLKDDVERFGGAREPSILFILWLHPAEGAADLTAVSDDNSARYINSKQRKFLDPIREGLLNLGIVQMEYN
jgi:hypothetical protein